MERQHWIDNLKVFAMFLVVLGHLQIDSYYQSYVYVFHIPLFFCASGFLYKKRSFKEELSKCFTRLLIPYFIFQILFCAILYNDVTVLKQNILGILMAENYRTELFASPCIPLWFLVALTIIRLIRSLSGKFGIVICLAITVLLSFFFRHGIQSILSLDSVLLCIPFFYLGEILRKKPCYLRYRGWMYALMLILLLVVNTWYCDSSNPMIDAANFSFGNSISLYYLFNTCICFCFLGFFCNYIKLRIPFFAILNDGMILILACHVIIGRVIIRLVPLHADILPLWMGIVVALISFVILLPVVHIVRNHAKIIIGR